MSFSTATARSRMSISSTAASSTGPTSALLFGRGCQQQGRSAAPPYLAFAVLLQQGEQTLAHLEAGPVGRHVELFPARQVERHVVVGRLEDCAVLMGDLTVERDDVGCRRVPLGV